MWSRVTVGLVAGALVVAAALLAFFPRYELQPLSGGPVSVRLDRWTGRVSVITVRRGEGSVYEAYVRDASLSQAR